MSKAALTPAKERPIGIVLDAESNRCVITGPYTDTTMQSFVTTCVQRRIATLRTEAQAVAPARPARTISPAARARMKAAAKKRWEEKNRQKTAPPAEANAPAPTTKAKGKKTKEATQAVGAGAGV